MIKEVEMIKMRKDIDHLIKNYFFSRVSLAKALDILPKVLRDFTVLKVVPQDANFYKMHNKIKAIKLEVIRNPKGDIFRVNFLGNIGSSNGVLFYPDEYEEFLEIVQNSGE